MLKNLTLTFGSGMAFGYWGFSYDIKNIQPGKYHMYMRRSYIATDNVNKKVYNIHVTDPNHPMVPVPRIVGYEDKIYYFGIVNAPLQLNLYIRSFLPNGPGTPPNNIQPNAATIYPEPYAIRNVTTFDQTYVLETADVVSGFVELCFISTDLPMASHAVI
jgi:hypothetical protein